MFMEMEALREAFLDLIKTGTEPHVAAKQLNIAARTGRRWASQIKKMTAAIQSPSIFDRPSDATLQRMRSAGKYAEHYDKNLKDWRRFIISSVQNDTAIHTEFLAALKVLAARVNAKLLLVPIEYHLTESSVFNVDPEDLYYENVNLCKRLKLLPRLQILPTIMDPFAGLDPISKSDTAIIGSPQMAMKTMATIGGSPAQMWATASVSLARGAYPRNKTGHKAEFNHSNGALIVELGQGDSFHIRPLNCDENGGFFDLPIGNEGYYSHKGFTPLDGIEALVPGDSHFSEADPKVLAATFFNDDSIAKVCKPAKVLFHDSFNCRSVSHHDEHNYLRRWGKFAMGISSIEGELNETGQHIANIVEALPATTDYWIVESNHDKHGDKWLTTADPKHDLVNAKFYHKMMYLTMEAMESKPTGPSFPGFYELWLRNSAFNQKLQKVKFLDGRKSTKIHGIEVGQHGDRGSNGAKGSAASFGRLPFKIIVGHSHTPCIKFGAYQTGTSSYLNLDYTGGASSWMQTHCIIYKNGKRALINVINGVWRSLIK